MHRQAQPQRVGKLAPLGHVATVHDVARGEADARGVDLPAGLRQVGEQCRVNCLLRVVLRRHERVALERLRIRNVAHRVGHDAEGVGLHDPPHGLPIGYTRGRALDDHPLGVLERSTIEAPLTVGAGAHDVLVLVPILDLRIVLHPEPTAPDVEAGDAADPVDRSLNDARQERRRRHVGRTIGVLVD